MVISTNLKKTLFILIITVISVSAQDKNNSKTLFFAGNINLTNNGFSFIPLFLNLIQTVFLLSFPNILTLNALRYLINKKGIYKELCEKQLIKKL